MSFGARTHGATLSPSCSDRPLTGGDQVETEPFKLGAGAVRVRWCRNAPSDVRRCGNAPSGQVNGMQLAHGGPVPLPSYLLTAFNAAMLWAAFNLVAALALAPETATAFCNMRSIGGWAKGRRILVRKKKSEERLSEVSQVVLRAARKFMVTTRSVP